MAAGGSVWIRVSVRQRCVATVGGGDDVGVEVGAAGLEHEGGTVWDRVWSAARILVSVEDGAVRVRLTVQICVAEGVVGRAGVPGAIAHSAASGTRVLVADRGGLRVTVVLRVGAPAVADEAVPNGVGVGVGVGVCGSVPVGAGVAGGVACDLPGDARPFVRVAVVRVMGPGVALGVAMGGRVGVHVVGENLSGVREEGV